MRDKSNDQWYARNVRRYEEKTAHLSMIEHGAYNLLLDFYYKTSSPLPATQEHLQRICRALAQVEVDALLSVLKQFFTLKDGFYHNKTADDEIEKRKQLTKSRINAAKSKPSKSVANAHTPTLTPTTLSEAKASSSDAAPNLFDEFWKLFPKQRAGSRSKAILAYKKAMKRATEEEIYAGIKRYCSSDDVARGFAKGAESWLNDDRWTDKPVEINSLPTINGKPNYADSIGRAAATVIDNIRREEDLGPQESL